MSKRTILIVSGLQYTGKSWLLKKIGEQNVLPDLEYVFIDKIRKSLYGARKDNEISRTEHLFKNEWFRQEIFRHLVCDSSAIAAEAVMLTRRRHQEPLVSIIKKAEIYIQKIEKEKKKNTSSRIILKVLLLYSDSKMIKERICRDQSERRLTDTPVFDLKGMQEAYSQFEFPDEKSYVPLYLNTTDESKESSEARIEEIKSFLNEGQLNAAEQDGRKKEAEKYFLEIKNLIEKGI